ncbi:MAG: PadR family transcriptional regulator [Solirubrobacterales bacterium]
MSASTRYAVLGLVARRPSYGYALLQQLRRWSVEPEAVRSSSVYTALTRLEQDALIEPLGPSATSGTDRQPRVTYSATPAGEQRFAEWLATPPSSYDDLRLRIVLARPTDLPVLIGFVIAAEEACLQRLQQLEAPPIASLTSRLAPWEAVAGAILGTLDTAELAGRAKWLQEVRVTLESLRDYPDPARA